MAQKTIKVGNFEDRDPGDYIEEGFQRCDDNFTELYAAIAVLQQSLDLTDAQWRTFTGGGVTYRVGTDTDGIFKIQQALTALGFGGTESTDEGVSGDYITLIPYRFGQ